MSDTTDVSPEAAVLPAAGQPAGAGQAATTDDRGTAVTRSGGRGPARQASLWGDAVRELARSPLFIFAAVVALIVIVMAIVPQVFTSTDPYACDLANSRQGPSAQAPFGYDLQGCDYYARTIYGARASIAIGFVAAAAAAAIGIVLGSTTGYYGGWFDAVVARIADIFFAIPVILGGLVILSALGTPGIFTVALVLVVITWPTLMRLMRSQVLSAKQQDYVQAARALGAGDVRIITRHILPNAIAPVIVYATIFVGVVIGAEATLTFLGVGLERPAISWGLALSEAQQYLTQSPHLLLFPGLFLTLTVLAFLIMGDQLRDALDPKLR
jgi:oligopeptide transport system permease protein